MKQKKFLLMLLMVSILFSTLNFTKAQTPPIDGKNLIAGGYKIYTPLVEPFIFPGTSSVNFLKPSDGSIYLFNQKVPAAATDTLLSDWMELTDLRNHTVEFFIQIPDTTHLKYQWRYRYGTSGAYLSTSIDSIKTIGTNSTSLAKGGILRGSTVNNIPGANWIQFFGVFQSGTETNSGTNVALIRRE